MIDDDDDADADADASDASDRDGGRRSWSPAPSRWNSACMQPRFYSLLKRAGAIEACDESECSPTFHGKLGLVREATAQVCCIQVLHTTHVSSNIPSDIEFTHTLPYVP